MIRFLTCGQVPAPALLQAQLDAQQVQQQLDAEAFAAQQAEQNSVGAPGFWEGLIPVWGSGRSALHNFQTGHWGLLDTAFLVLDVVAVVAGVLSFGQASEGSGRDCPHRTGHFRPRRDTAAQGATNARPITVRSST